MNSSQRRKKRPFSEAFLSKQRTLAQKTLLFKITNGSNIVKYYNTEFLVLNQGFLCLSNKTIPLNSLEGFNLCFQEKQLFCVQLAIDCSFASQKYVQFIAKYGSKLIKIGFQTTNEDGIFKLNYIKCSAGLCEKDFAEVSQVKKKESFRASMTINCN
jgi:hypothetical protein